MTHAGLWVISLWCLVLLACGVAEAPAAPASTPTPISADTPVVDTPSLGTPIALTATPTSPPTPAVSLQAPSPTVTVTAVPLSTATDTPTNTPSPTSSPTPDTRHPRPFVTIGETTFGAELAITPAERTQGLSGREELPRQTGLLFIFESRRASSFWMKEMRFPLDFVWISEDCVVVDITRDVPHPQPNSPTSALPTYSSSAPAAYNFEINGAEAAELGIEVGDAVLFTGIPDEVGETCEE